MRQWEDCRAEAVDGNKTVDPSDSIVGTRAKLYVLLSQFSGAEVVRLKE